ncbi:hypothetical protein BH20ACT6_BH20ACT6_03980 [soil metagenome]
MAEQQLLDHRVLGLPAHPASAGLARQLVEEVLAEAVPADVLENAQLLVSEVVTNAIVHARSDIGLTVSLVREFVRVEVADHSPHLPVLRPRGGSVTGYGLDLVASLAADFGVIADEAGKAVWFTLGQPAARPPSPVDDTGDAVAFPEPEPNDAAAAAAMVDVTLLGVPVGLYCAWHDQAATALREQLLIHLGHSGAGDVRAADEIATVNTALSQLAQVTEPVFKARAGRSERAATADRQTLLLDVSFRLPVSLIPRFGVLREVLDDASQLAASELLAPAGEPEVGDVQDWCCIELLRQASGLEPTRWHA